MKGLIFIPDISGFTNFVKNIDMELGVAITRDLLNEIIVSNPLKLHVSEIEGDAILYYKVGEPIPVKDIFSGFETIKTAFDKKFRELKKRYHLEQDLSLKAIVHYGELTVYYLRGFKNLYGQAVVEAHRLLKNSSATKDYILITEDYFKALEQESSVSQLPANRDAYNAKQFVDFREIEYHCFNQQVFDPVEAVIPVPALAS